MRVVQQAPGILIGLPADRPAPERVPIGSMFFATDTNETFIAVDGHWHSMGATQNNSISTDPEIRPMNPQRRFKYTCRGSYRGDEHNHDTFDFFWDGVRNLADKKSIEIASMYDELAGCRKKCSKCGNNLEGGEIYQQHLLDAPESPAMRELKNLSENLHPILEKLGSIERRLDQVEERIATAVTDLPVQAMQAPTIEYYLAYLRTKYPSVDEKVVRGYIRDLAEGKLSVANIPFMYDEVTRDICIRVANAERDRMLANEPKTLLEKLRAKTRAQANLEEQSAKAAQDLHRRLTEDEKRLLRERIGPAFADGTPTPVEVWPRLTSMAVNFGAVSVSLNEWQRLFAMVENMTNDTLPPLTNEEIIALRNRLGLSYPLEAVTPATENRPETPTNGKTMTEESKMKKIGKTLKANAGEAAWRVGAAQATRTAKAAVVAGILKSVPKTEKAMRKQLVAFFDTAYGDAAIAGMLAIAIELAGVPEGSKRGKLAEELRVGAMSGAANEFLSGPMDVLLSFMTGGLDTILEGMPEPEAAASPKVRVDATAEAETEEEGVEAVGAQARAAG